MLKDFKKLQKLLRENPSPEFMQKALSRYNHEIISALDVIPVEAFAHRAKERVSVVKWAKKSFEMTRMGCGSRWLCPHAGDLLSLLKNRFWTRITMGE